MEQAPHDSTTHPPHPDRVGKNPACPLECCITRPALGASGVVGCGASLLRGSSLPIYGTFRALAFVASEFSKEAIRDTIRRLDESTPQVPD